ncbi:hypothetical protein [Teredinibacter purpureus]|uniref:hypothetical protein n=1 Tax=Teredinibacter purpureus TaxID=2731756 RepID=UPI0013C4C07E|nr:hypothetical protein [Teredinibacter purpureus]
MPNITDEVPQQKNEDVGFSLAQKISIGISLTAIGMSLTAILISVISLLILL